MPFSFADLISAWITAVWAGKITSIPSSIPERLRNPQERLDYLYEQRVKSAPAERKVDPNDPVTYVGYHLLGGSLKEGPPSEMHFSAALYKEIEEVDRRERSNLAGNGTKRGKKNKRECMAGRKGG